MPETFASKEAIFTAEGVKQQALGMLDRFRVGLRKIERVSESDREPVVAEASEVAVAMAELKDPQVDFVFETPQIDSSTRINYHMPEVEGRELSPGRRLVFKIPEQFRYRIVRDVILRHRKASKYEKDIESGGWDPHGAYSRVELHDTETGQWTRWRDPAGYRTDKFAEPRSASNPEEEVLHDWIATVGELRIDGIRVTNVGQHQTYSTSQIHDVEVVFFPELEGTTYQERIYCAGTEFIDLEKGKLLPSYGGGEHTEGKYVGAIALNKYGDAPFELGKDPGTDARLEGSRLVVKLEDGAKLEQVEISVGDTEYLGDRAHGGKRTRLGWAKLWVGIRRGGMGTVEWFIKNANIPPQGVIAGGPHLESANIQEGDELVIESRADTAYVMGWRVAYKNNGK